MKLNHLRDRYYHLKKVEIFIKNLIKKKTIREVIIVIVVSEIYNEIQTFEMIQEISFNQTDKF